MKRWLFWSFITVATFLVGCAVVIGIRIVVKYNNEASRFDVASVHAVEIETVGQAIVPLDVPPVFDPSINYAKTAKVKLLQAGQFHSEEVPYQNGERWLGLFRNGDGDELAWTTIKKSNINDDGLFDTEIATGDSRRSIFLLRGAHDLEPGPVTTLFEDVDGEKLFDFRNDKSFSLKGQFWWLWIENAEGAPVPQKGSSLVIKQTGYDAQVLRTLPDGCNDCSWQLLWVGDLNGDRNLDFLIDVSDHYNAYEPTLFLSSAGNGYSVYASFRGVGC